MRLTALNLAPYRALTALHLHVALDIENPSYVCEALDALVPLVRAAPSALRMLTLTCVLDAAPDYVVPSADDARTLADHALDAALVGLAGRAELAHVDVAYAQERGAPPYDVVERTLEYVFPRLKEKKKWLRVQRVPYGVTHAIMERLPSSM